MLREMYAQEIEKLSFFEYIQPHFRMPRLFRRSSFGYLETTPSYLGIFWIFFGNVPVYLWIFCNPPARILSIFALGGDSVRCESQELIVRSWVSLRTSLPPPFFFAREILLNINRDTRNLYIVACCSYI